jgi:hypothetical protein
VKVFTASSLSFVKGTKEFSSMAMRGYRLAVVNSRTSVEFDASLFNHFTASLLIASGHVVAGITAGTLEATEAPIFTVAAVVMEPFAAFIRSTSLLSFL